VRLLAAAGVKSIQPGVESFSDQILKLMRKGVSGLQNIQLLKWCKEFGVEPLWNFLWGFPGESPEEYRRMADLIPRLTHLPGPAAGSSIRLDRFSPNFFDAARLGFVNVRPLPPYRFIYDVPDEARANLAYYFAYDYQQPTDVSAYVRAMVKRLDTWRTSWRRSELLAVDLDDTAAILDTRPGSRIPLTVLDGLDRDIYLACDEVSDLPRVLQCVPASGHGSCDVIRRLDRMVARGIMVNDGARYLSLAVPLGRYKPTGASAARLLATLSHLSTARNGTLHIPLTDSAYALDGDVPRKSSMAAGPVRGRRRLQLSRANFSVTARRELRVDPGQRAH
jgi:hypothetical protein